MWKVLKIIVFAGWILFFMWNLKLAKYFGTEYNKDPSNFVFFENEMDRQAYKTNIYQGNLQWVDQASLIDQCKPMVWFNDFYFEKIDPLVTYFAVLILLTLISRIDPKEAIDSFDKFADWMDSKFGDDEE